MPPSTNWYMPVPSRLISSGPVAELARLILLGDPGGVGACGDVVGRTPRALEGDQVDRAAVHLEVRLVVRDDLLHRRELLGIGVVDGHRIADVGDDRVTFLAFVVEDRDLVGRHVGVGGTAVVAGERGHARLPARVRVRNNPTAAIVSGASVSAMRSLALRIGLGEVDHPVRAIHEGAAHREHRPEQSQDGTSDPVAERHRIHHRLDHRHSKYQSERNDATAVGSEPVARHPHASHQPDRIAC